MTNALAGAVDAATATLSEEIRLAETKRRMETPEVAAKLEEVRGTIIGTAIAISTPNSDFGEVEPEGRVSFAGRNWGTLEERTKAIERSLRKVALLNDHSFWESTIQNLISHSWQGPTKIEGGGTLYLFGRTVIITRPSRSGGCWSLSLLHKGKPITVQLNNGYLEDPDTWVERIQALSEIQLILEGEEVPAADDVDSTVGNTYWVNSPQGRYMFQVTSGNEGQLVGKRVSYNAGTIKEDEELTHTTKDFWTNVIRTCDNYGYRREPLNKPTVPRSARALQLLGVRATRAKALRAQFVVRGLKYLIKPDDMPHYNAHGFRDLMKEKPFEGATEDEKKVLAGLYLVLTKNSLLQEAFQCLTVGELIEKANMLSRKRLHQPAGSHLENILEAYERRLVYLLRKDELLDKREEDHLDILEEKKTRVRRQVVSALEA